MGSAAEAIGIGSRIGWKWLARYRSAGPGGGRQAADGINALPAAMLDDFVSQLRAFYSQ